MTESKCYRCKHLLKINQDNEDTCILNNGVDIRTVWVCSHFEEKPEDRKSKPLASARLSTSCVQPSNHGRKGKPPRKQPKKI